MEALLPCAAAGCRSVPHRAARVHRRQRSDLRPSLHAGGYRSADPSIGHRGSDRPVVRSFGTPVAGPDSEENLQQQFLQNYWTDYLPITLPTEEPVAAMLKGTSHAPDEIVGRMRPTAFREFWEYTVEKVAVNAVMAGARPEYFPVILALAASGSTARSSSTTSMTNMAVVNGPIRHGSATPPSSLRTIGDALNEAGISWAYYAGGYDAALRVANGSR